MLEILFAPIDPSRAHEVGFAVSWHGRLMVLAWGFLLPLGVIVARFFKVLPGQDWPHEIQNPFWFKWHRILQYAGLTLITSALIMIVMTPRQAPGAALHHWLGWSVIALAVVQVTLVMFKGSGGGPGPDGVAQGDHFTMALRRRVFEVLHKNLGYLALLVSIVSIISGMWVANGYLWMWIVMGVWWVILAVLFYNLQTRGHNIDTYQAIWGTDPSHPGNQIPPIGWGIRRGPPVPFDQTINIKKRQLAARGKTPDRH